MYYAKHPFTTWIPTLIVSKAPIFVLSGHSREVGQREDWWLHVGRPGVECRILWQRELFWWAKQYVMIQCTGYSYNKLLSMCLFKHFCSLVQWTDKQRDMNFQPQSDIFAAASNPGRVAEVLWMDLTTSILLGDGWSQFSCSAIKHTKMPSFSTRLCCSLCSNKDT